MVPKAKAKLAPTAKAKLKKERAHRSNSRQAQRRQAVSELNGLAHEFGVEPIPVKAPCNTVEKLVRALDRQDLDHEFALQLREAAELYVSNGGHFGVQLGPIPEPATSGALAQLQRHRVLQDTFILQSKAFMLTYNNRSFSPDTWTGGRGGGRTAAGRRQADRRAVRRQADRRGGGRTGGWGSGRIAAGGEAGGPRRGSLSPSNTILN